MLPITVLAVGSLKERWMGEACGEYEKRLSGHGGRLEVIGIPEARVSDRPNAYEIAKALEKEGEAFRKRLPSRYYTIAMCSEGEQMSSEELAARLLRIAQEYPGAAFLIGSSHGLDEAVKKEARLRLSFSPMTFPHQLARVMLLEQLYRCHTLIEGGKYHK